MSLTMDDGHRTQLAKLQMVIADPATPSDIVDHAGSLAGMHPLVPETIEDRIEEWAFQVIGNIQAHSPSVDYARCISYDTLFDHYIDTTVQDGYDDSQQYLQHILELPSDPTSTIWADLRRPILVPARYSWMIPAHDLTSEDATTIKNQLQILSDPPFLLMEFSGAEMIQCGLDVRRPCSLDAIRSNQLQWTPNGVPNERIDGDIPFAALKDLRWIT